MTRLRFFLTSFASIGLVTTLSAADPITRTGQTFVLEGRTVTVRTWDVVAYVENDMSQLCVFDAYDNPKLAELRDRYKLDDVVAAGKDEFEKQLLLMEWVRKQVQFGNPGQLGGLRDALKILELSKQGQRFFCVQCAALYISAAATQGWVARPLALRRPNSLGGSSPEHSTTEIWSNQHRRWVMFDPTFALYVERDGAPLNSWEIRQEFFYNHAKNLVFVDRTKNIRYRKIDVEKPYPAQLFAFIGYVPNNNLMDAGPDWGRMVISKTDDEVCNSTNWHIRPCPKDPAVDPYFPINQAALSLHPEGGALKVNIKTLTPNFRQFQIRFDDKDWQPTDASFPWALRKDTNKLDARSVNQFGVPGPVSTVVLDVE